MAPKKGGSKSKGKQPVKKVPPKRPAPPVSDSEDDIMVVQVDQRTGNSECPAPKTLGVTWPWGPGGPAAASALSAVMPSTSSVLAGASSPSGG